MWCVWCVCINMRWLHSCHTGFMSKSSLLSPNAAAVACISFSLFFFLFHLYFMHMYVCVCVFVMREVILHKMLLAVRKKTWLLLLLVGRLSIGSIQMWMRREEKTNKMSKNHTKQCEKQTSALLWQWVLCDDVICGHIKKKIPTKQIRTDASPSLWLHHAICLL